MESYELNLTGQNAETSREGGSLDHYHFGIVFSYQR